jgi:hypothetical protein
MASTVHIRKGTQWKSICADEIDYQIFKGSFYQVKKGDWISVNGVWQQILCPVVNHPWGFDMVNREIQIINSFPTIKFRHKVVFENSDDTYDYANDPFVIRTTINAQVGFPDGDVYIKAKNPEGTTIWTFGPVSSGYYNSVKDFAVNGTNTYMEIEADFYDGDAFQLTTEPMGGNNVDWSGVPFPVDYDSNS